MSDSHLITLASTVKNKNIIKEDEFLCKTEALYGFLKFISIYDPLPRDCHHNRPKCPLLCRQLLLLGASGLPGEA